jgi:hypothetical protein
MQSIGASVDKNDVTTQITEIRQKHSALENRLEELNGSVHLTTAEELEVRQIKRQKLRMKDLINHLETLV